MTKIKLLVIVSIGAFIAFSSCKAEEDTSCYDSAMEAAHSGICTQDCPSICGCDGKTYCNECIANSKGISKVADGPCP